jgi:hypothetical protein
MMIIVDYSASMNLNFGAGTRWDATVDAIATMLDTDNGFIGNNLNLAMMRFGHDPDELNPGTTIGGDVSSPPIRDGQAIDIEWYDTGGGPVDYIECNGQAVKTAIQTVPPPMNGAGSGIGTWTKGAMDRSASLIGQSRADHGEAVGDRTYLQLVITDGAYTGPDGTAGNVNPSVDNPAITAAAQWNNEEVATYVVAVDQDAMSQGFMDADALAAAGGTNSAIDGSTPNLLVQALQTVIQEIKDEVIAPECVGGMPRMMVLLDASSSMLNSGASFASAEGVSGWDQARDALSGDNSIFDGTVNTGDAVEDLSQLGLAVFGHDAPDESAILVNYGPCMKDNFAWALDPNSSCLLPGCDPAGNGNGPWDGPTIGWSSQDGSAVSPFFDVSTISHMPACDTYPGDARCTGSGTYTHLGLNLIASNQAAYHAAAQSPGAEFPANADTDYINLMITDGQYNSTDAQIQTALESMQSNGITTYVIGFGEFQSFQTELDNMASWGSNGANPSAYTATNQAQLEAQIQAIINDLVFDPCCGFNDCSENPEPTTNEPDPTTGSGSGTGSSSGTGSGGDDGSGTASGGDKRHGRRRRQRHRLGWRRWQRHRFGRRRRQRHCQRWRLRRRGRGRRHKRFRRIGWRRWLRRGRRRIRVRREW